GRCHPSFGAPAGVDARTPPPKTSGSPSSPPRRALNNRLSSGGAVSYRPLTTAAPPRSGFAVIRDRNFGPFFVGNLTSNIGTWFQQVTSAIVIYDLTGSTFMVGMVGVSQFLPSLLLAPFTGAAADRFDRRKLLM